MSQNICNICGTNYEYRNGKWVCPCCDAIKPDEITNKEELKDKQKDNESKSM